MLGVVGVAQMHLHVRTWMAGMLILVFSSVTPVKQTHLTHSLPHVILGSLQRLVFQLFLYFKVSASHLEVKFVHRAMLHRALISHICIYPALVLLVILSVRATILRCERHLTSCCCLLIYSYTSCGDGE